VIVLSNYDEPIAEEVGKAVFKMMRGGGAAGSGRQAVTVPMQVIDHQPAVDVGIEGQGPFLFLIDTGAADAGMIHAELAEHLGLEVVLNSEIRDVVRVGELKLGDRTWNDLEMLVAPRDPGDRGIDGILGFRLFEDSLLTLDYPASELRVTDGALPAADGREILEFTDDQGIPTIELDVAGRKVRADLDSGSMGGLMLPTSIAAELPLGAEPAVIGSARTSFNEFDILAAPLDGDLRVGRHRMERPQMQFASIFPRGNVGSEFLEHFTLTFDQANRRVRFARDGEDTITMRPRYRVGVMMADGTEGLIVQGTVPDSPGERAGFVDGDRLLRINGATIAELPPGELGRVFGRPEPIRIVVRRDSEELELEVTPEPIH